MKLRDLLPFDSIVIQTHDNPDADAIASGFGLYSYFLSKGKKVRLIYGGKNKIGKSNLLLMTEMLQIPIEHCGSLDAPELLITVDCQWGESNVQRFPGKHLAVIDHHIPSAQSLPALREIRDQYGACATLVWDMLNDEGFSVLENQALSTALYYGLYMDTGKMQELRHPKDRDLRDTLEFRANKSQLARFINCNLSLEELSIVGDAMVGIDSQASRRYAAALAKPCDPNILGIISDAVIEVDTINVCVVCCMVEGGFKLSVRSCERETRADELAAFIAQGLGSGGGHARKAGAFLAMSHLEEACRTKYSDFAPEKMSAFAFRLVRERLDEYFTDQVLIRSGADVTIDLTQEPLYEKKRLPMGYVKGTRLFPAGTPVVARMLEGDIQLTIQEDTYFIIGVEGEVYKNDEAYLFAHNTVTAEPYTVTGAYAPTLRSAIRGDAPTQEDMMPKSLADYACQCIPKEGSRVHARALEKRTKVFVPWSDSYMLGLPGDYLAARQENPSDVYIIKKDIMQTTYFPCGG